VHVCVCVCVCVCVYKVPHFSPSQKFITRYIGSLAMYLVIRKRRKTERNTHTHVADQLHVELEKWTEALGGCVVCVCVCVCVWLLCDGY